MRTVLIGLGLVLAVSLAVFAIRPLAVHANVLLLMAQEFPQVPVKPLGLLSAPPRHEWIELVSPHGRIVADRFVPQSPLAAVATTNLPAIVIAMGIKTHERDRPHILHLADTLARLGYLVLWPRSEVLDRGVPRFEEPETFVQAVEYLAGLELVNPDRVSLVGFSVGSSIALVAAGDERIAGRVRSVLFFGGYYDAFDYVASLATSRIATRDGLVAWRPAPDAVNHLKEILAEQQAHAIARVFSAGTLDEARAILADAPAAERELIGRLDPARRLSTVQARVFILHDESDPYVHYSESLRLADALAQQGDVTVRIVNLFEHVQPKRDLSPALVQEFAKVYSLLYELLSYL